MERTHVEIMKVTDGALMKHPRHPDLGGQGLNTGPYGPLSGGGRCSGESITVPRGEG